ncbi:hypothetical protein BGZ76_006215 [Entomortierella beljakovae]|nr:hypothetical protein BGZ76_006215 [Entomortierella beljakovae]
MKTFSTSDMDIAKDKGANEIVQDESYQLHTLGIKPASSSMFETLVSRMPYLINLSLLFVGTVKLFPSVQQFCPNLTSLIVDMEAQTYPHDSIAEDDPDLHIKFADWIDLFNTLTKLERFEGRSVSLPTVVLKALADSCPNLRYFKTCSDSTVSAFGASYLLSHCHSLTDMILNQMYFLCLFNGDEPWRAPIENLVLDAVVFKASEENDVFRERMRQLPYLRSLSIYYTGDMTIRALIDPAEKYNFVPSAIPRNVKSIPKVPFLRLELLNLGYFSESSPESFAKIASCMPRLESLSLGSVKKTYDRKTKSNLIITN